MQNKDFFSGVKIENFVGKRLKILLKTFIVGTRQNILA